MCVSYFRKAPMLNLFMNLMVHFCNQDCREFVLYEEVVVFCYWKKNTLFCETNFFLLIDFVLLYARLITYFCVSVSRDS